MIIRKTCRIVTYNRSEIAACAVDGSTLADCLRSAFIPLSQSLEEL